MARLPPAGSLLTHRDADPWALGGSVLLLGATALVASFVPARRATHVPPTLALRAD